MLVLSKLSRAVLPILLLCALLFLPSAVLGGARRGKKSVGPGIYKVWGMHEVAPDGAQCAAVSNTQIGGVGGPKVPSIICTDNDAAFIEGVARLPAHWSNGPIRFEMSYSQTAADTGSFRTDVEAQCCASDGGLVNNVFGTAVPMFNSAVTGSSYLDTSISETVVTPGGTCGPDDYLFWRIGVDADDTTTAMATNPILSVTMSSYGPSDNVARGRDFSEDDDCLGAWIIFSDGVEASSGADHCDATGQSGDDAMAWQGPGVWAASDLVPVGTPIESGETTRYQSVDFDELAGSYFLDADDPDFDANDFTLGCWVIKDSSDSDDFIMGNNKNNAWDFSTTAADLLYGETEYGNETSAAGTVPIDEWHHLMMRRTTTTGTVELFIDGVESCNGACGASVGSFTGDAFGQSIGASPGGADLMDGRMMECVYFDRGLTDTEIAELFLCGFYGNADGTARDTAYGGAQCADIDNACCY